MRKIKHYKWIFAFVLVALILIAFYVSTEILHETKGKIVITFDDSPNSRSVRDHALPLMNQYGFRGTTFFTTNYLVWKEKREWFKPLIQEFIDNGWEIGSHTHWHSHLNSVSEETLHSEIERPKQLYESEFPGINDGLGIITFAYPFGEGWNNETVDSLVRATYKYVRPLGRWKQYPPDNLGSWGKTFSTSFDNTCVEKTQEAIDFAKKEGVWVWLMFHGVSGNPVEEYGSYSPRFVSVKNFTVCLELIKSSELSVITMKGHLHANFAAITRAGFYSIFCSLTFTVNLKRR